MSQNVVHRESRLIGDVQLGSSNVIEAGATIVGPIRIGDGNYFGPNCVVGASAQDELLADELRQGGLSSGSDGLLTIGNRNVFREFTTIHRGLTGKTTVGDDCYLMAYAHVAHDCVIRNRAKIANAVQLGGYCWIGRGAYLGLSAALHQFVVVGGFSMVGMGSVVTQMVPPASLVYGNPARVVRPNTVALERLGVSHADWWEKMRTGTLDVCVPVELTADVAEFDEAVGRAASLRGSVSDWRDSQSESDGSF